MILQEFTAQLSHRLDDPNLTKSNRAVLRCTLAKELAEAGDYEAARASLEALWRRVGERPNLAGLDQAARAEVLLQVGTLTSCIGSAGQLAGAQEMAKDLITEASEIFTNMAQLKRRAECRINLAICYWHEGALDEARITLQNALAHFSAIDAEPKARALIMLAIVEISAHHYEQALEYLTQASPLVNACRNPALKGRFHHQYGLAQRKLADQTGPERERFLDRALMSYTEASYYYEQAGHDRFRAGIENNIGYICYTLAQFEAAHEHLDRAYELFVELTDKVRAAQVDDTRASVFVAQSRYGEAEQAITRALDILEEGDEQALLIESLLTRGTILARTQRFDEAYECFARAASVAVTMGDAETAGSVRLKIIEELNNNLSSQQLITLFLSADDALKNNKALATLRRFRSCGRIVIESNKGDHRAAARVPDGGCSLDAEVHKLESQLIQEALKKADGKITKAAGYLGLTHQGLDFMLQTRHKALLTERATRRRRFKPLIKR